MSTADDDMRDRHGLPPRQFAEPELDRMGRLPPEYRCDPSVVHGCKGHPPKGGWTEGATAEGEAMWAHAMSPQALLDAQQVGGLAGVSPASVPPGPGEGDLRGALWRAVNGWVCSEVQGCTCAGGGEWPHESHCGLEPLCQVGDNAASLAAEHNAAVEQRTLADEQHVETYRLLQRDIDRLVEQRTLAEQKVEAAEKVIAEMRALSEGRPAWPTRALAEYDRIAALADPEADRGGTT